MKTPQIPQLCHCEERSDAAIQFEASWIASTSTRSRNDDPTTEESSTVQPETYLHLCTEYYDLDKPQADGDELAFYLHYARQQGGPVLEPMCGSGRFLIPFMQAGFEIEGFDASPFMLDALRQKCAAHVWEGWLQDLDKEERYALAFIPSGSFNLITNPADVKSSLRRIYHSLKEGGLFVVEIIALTLANTTSSTKRRVAQKTRPDGRVITMRIADLPWVDGIGTSVASYELTDASGTLQSETETYRIQFYRTEDFALLLKEAGFQDVIITKAFAHNQLPDHDDEVIVYECRKG